MGIIKSKKNSTENAFEKLLRFIMRMFDYRAEYKKLLSPDIVALLTTIHEYRGKQNRLIEKKSGALTQLLEIAKIQSTDASNRIEGITVPNDRLNLLVREKSMPRDPNEAAIAGYRDVLATIYESYNYIPLRAAILLQLHRDLYKYSGRNIGGSYKNTDNVIQETLPDGTERIRLEAVSAMETPEAMEKLCTAINQAIDNGEMDPLLLIPMFVLDFLCIHPFNDGNGRMSRLLTLLMLYRAEYFAGKYISIEKLISDSKETYYEALQESSEGWHDSNNDYEPFVRYLLGIVIAAYREFDQRTELLEAKGVSKPDRVRALIKDQLGTITKTEIMHRLPDISQVTVQRALAELLKNNEIIKISGGRYTSYTWNRENEL